MTKIANHLIELSETDEEIAESLQCPEWITFKAEYLEEINELQNRKLAGKDPRDPDEETYDSDSPDKSSSLEDLLAVNILNIII